MTFRLLLIAALVLATAAFAQNPITADSPFQVRYASNLNAGDSVINITNTGARGAGLQAGTTASITGSLCVSAYAFSPDEQMIACCSCPVTPNGLRSLSAQDFIGHIRFGGPSSFVVKLLASIPVGGSCAGSAASPGSLAQGMAAWGTTLHAAPGGGYQVTETSFIPATLSDGELSRLTNHCMFILANGSGYGICKSCRLGGLGGARR